MPSKPKAQADAPTAGEQQLISLTDNFLDRKAHIFFLPISMQQMATSQDMPARGNVWAARTTVTVTAKDTVATLFQRAINGLANGPDQKVEVGDCVVEDVKAQWSGWRADVSRDEEEPEVEEGEKYERLMGEVTSDLTMLHAHGGFY